MRFSGLGVLVMLLPAGCGGSTSSPASDAGGSDAGGSDAPMLFPDAGGIDTGAEAGDGGGSICTPGSLALAGDLKGGPVSQTYSSAGVGYQLTAPGYVLYQAFGTNGVIYALGSNGPLSMQTLQWGVLAMPTEGPDPGGLYCTGSGSTYSETTMNTWTLEAMVRAGACPSSGAAQGDWLGCSADSEWTPEDGGPYEGAPCVAGETHVTGTLDGTAFDWKILDTVGLGSSGGSGTSIDNLFDSIGDSGFLLLNASTDDAGPGTLFGVFRPPASVAPTQPFFCVSSTSTATSTDHATRFTLRGVTTAGTCSGASGSSHVDVCGPT